MLPDFAWALELVAYRCHALRKGEKSCEVEPEQTMDGQWDCNNPTSGVCMLCLSGERAAGNCAAAPWP